MKEVPSYVGVFVPGHPEPVALFNRQLGESVAAGAGALPLAWAAANLIHYEIRDVWLTGGMIKSAPWTGKGTSR